MTLDQARHPLANRRVIVSRPGTSRPQWPNSPTRTSASDRMFASLDHPLSGSAVLAAGRGPKTEKVGVVEIFRRAGPAHPQTTAHRPRFPGSAPRRIGRGDGRMIARNGLSSPRKRRTVARMPMEDHPPKSPAGPAKTRVPPVPTSFHERPRSTLRRARQAGSCSLRARGQPYFLHSGPCCSPIKPPTALETEHPKENPIHPGQFGRYSRDVV